MTLECHRASFYTHAAKAIALPSSLKNEFVTYHLWMGRPYNTHYSFLVGLTSLAHRKNSLNFLWTFNNIIISNLPIFHPRFLFGEPGIFLFGIIWFCCSLNDYRIEKFSPSSSVECNPLVHTCKSSLEDTICSNEDGMQFTGFPSLICPFHSINRFLSSVFSTSSRSLSRILAFCQPISSFQFFCPKVYKSQKEF